MLEKSIQKHKEKMLDTKNQKIVPSGKTANEKALDDDFEKARQTLSDLIDSSTQLFNEIAGMAQMTDNPARMYEVAIQANKAAQSAANDLLKLHKSKKDGKEYKDMTGEKPKAQVTNAIQNQKNITINANTKDLNKLTLEDIDKLAEKEGIKDAEIEE